jgi:Amt family ammonium transporter
VLPAAFNPTTYSISAQLWVQVKAVAFTLVYSGVLSWVLFFVIDKTMGLRPSREVESEGLDINEHGERAYNL